MKFPMTKLFTGGGFGKHLVTTLTMEQFPTQFKTILQPMFFFVKDFGQLEFLNGFLLTSRVLLRAYIKYDSNLFTTMHSTRHRVKNICEKVTVFLELQTWAFVDSVHKFCQRRVFTFRQMTMTVDYLRH